MNTTTTEEKSLLRLVDKLCDERDIARSLAGKLRRAVLEDSEYMQRTLKRKNTLLNAASLIPEEWEE